MQRIRNQLTSENNGSNFRTRHSSPHFQETNEQMKQPLWSVKLKRDKTVVREHVVALDAESAIATAKEEHEQYQVISVAQIRQIGTNPCDTVLIANGGVS